MRILKEIRERFRPAISQRQVDLGETLAKIRPANNPKFGDYQGNFAMEMGSRLGAPPRKIAEEIVGEVALEDICQSVEVAGPGFINLRLRDDWLANNLAAAFADERLGVEAVVKPRTYIVDFSSPNVAKPMHVGHIRSTVIGDCLAKILRFVGHRVVTDNHLGDWGAQFGMIIYGYKHFRNDAEFEKDPIKHLSDLYRLTRRLIDYHESKIELPKSELLAKKLQTELEELKSEAEPTEANEKKKRASRLKELGDKLRETQEECQSLQSKIQGVEGNEGLKRMADQHSTIAHAYLDETAKLHAGDPENMELWKRFMPICLEDIHRIYRRLNVEFDHELGESFYHGRLPGVVEKLQAERLAVFSDGAICVFLEGLDTPMIIQKKDGAYLYATTDVATIDYRFETWNPDEILYVVDHRQHEHFTKLFLTAERLGYPRDAFRHVSFGTVLGEDGRPYKTRSGDTVGLESLLDEAESRALQVLQAIGSEREKPLGPEREKQISRTVGIGALKFADLSQDRTSDYKFSYDKMLELKGNTATYLQYLYARVQGIYRRLELDPDQFRRSPRPFLLGSEIERSLAISLLQFGDVLDDVLADYKPHRLTEYLFQLTQTFFKFYSQCSVANAESDELRWSRLQFCELTARTVQTGLALLGIDVVDEM